MNNKLGIQKIHKTEGDADDFGVKNHKAFKFMLPKRNSIMILPNFSISHHKKVQSKDSMKISITSISQEKLLDLLCLSTQDLKQKFSKPPTKHEKIKIINTKWLPKDFFGQR